MSQNYFKQKFDETQKIVKELQDELAETNRGLLALTLEMHQSDNNLEKKIQETLRTVKELEDELAETNTGLIALTIELQQAEEKYRSIFENAVDAIITCNDQGMIETFNPASKRMFGYDKSKIIGKDIKLLVPQFCTNRSVKHFGAVSGDNKLDDNSNREALGRDSNGTFFPIDLTVGEVRHGDSKIFTCIIRDITQRKKIEENLRLTSKVYESSHEGILITDPEANIINVNQAFCNITGYSKEEVIGQNPRIMKSEKHDNKFYQNMWDTLLKTGKWQGEVWDRRKDGEIYPKWLSISVVKANNGATSHFVGMFTDITSIKKTEKRLQRLAHNDPLTGLPNRILFNDRLVSALYQSQRNKYLVGLMFLDLDRFKDINDTLGHRAGDQLLIDVARRLKKCVRDTDTVARFGGDEFTVIVTHINNTESIAIVARKMIDALSCPFHLEGHEIHITVSIGITVAPDDGTDMDSLLKYADSAMFYAKARGKNNFQFYSQEMNRKILERLQIENSLRQAINSGEFLLHYQPQVDFQTGLVIGMEALIRWQHPEHGLIPPGKFIPLAEETGLIIPIGEWVLRTACEQTKAWQTKGWAPLRMAINISGTQFKLQNQVETVKRILQETGLDPNYLNLELTESVVMENAKATIKTLNELKKMGVQLSIDDFGTGYSSLSYLKQFPIDILKIDQSFVRDITTDSNDAAIATTIIALAHSLKMKVIAEGVETEKQQLFLRKNNCDGVQGFYFGRPVPAKEFEEKLRNGQYLLTPKMHLRAL